MEKVDMLADRAFEDQCTTANPRLPLVEELKQIRGFLDGIKEEEVRGAFRAKFVDKIDAAADKAAEGKGGSK